MRSSTFRHGLVTCRVLWLRACLIEIMQGVVIIVVVIFMRWWSWWLIDLFDRLVKYR